MDFASGLVLLIALIVCVLFVREGIKAEQKKKLEKQRLEKLGKVGEIIVTTVQLVNGNRIDAK